MRCTQSPPLHVLTSSCYMLDSFTYFTTFTRSIALYCGILYNNIFTVILSVYDFTSGYKYPFPSHFSDASLSISFLFNSAWYLPCIALLLNCLSFSRIMMYWFPLLHHGFPVYTRVRTLSALITALWNAVRVFCF